MSKPPGIDEYADAIHVNVQLCLPKPLARRVAAATAMPLAEFLNVAPATDGDSTGKVNAVICYLLHRGLDAHEGDSAGDTAAPAPTARAETKVNITNADGSGSWAKDGTAASFEWSGKGELHQVFSGEVPPRRRGLAECMVILLDDTALCDQLRAVATPGCFGQVIHDVAAAMSGEL